MKAIGFGFSQESRHQNDQQRLVQSIKKLLDLIALLSTTAQINTHSEHISCKHNFKNIHNYIEKVKHTFLIYPLEEGMN
tara:strand:- start:120 stop:356 length:237 start_codon:yes stop_codon:yes gene_type:complete